MIFASIPSPGSSQFEIGPLTFHYYALCIILGVIVAVNVGKRRYVKLGGAATMVGDIAIFAVPAGIIGGRIYHVITSPDLYFGKTGDLISALYIWKGGMGIWGAISMGFLAAFIAYRRSKNTFGIPFSSFADAIAPGILFAQAIGRLGNWFNRELYGRPFDGPWALEIPGKGLFHPVFLYEGIWCVVVAILLIKVPKLSKLASGSIFALYVALYCLGRGVIETIRIDEASLILGLRLNVWTSLIVGCGALIYLIKQNRSRPAIQ